MKTIENQNEFIVHFWTSAGVVNHGAHVGKKPRISNILMVYSTHKNGKIGGGSGAVRLVGLHFGCLARVTPRCSSKYLCRAQLEKWNPALHHKWTTPRCSRFCLHFLLIIFHSKPTIFPWMWTAIYFDVKTKVLTCHASQNQSGLFDVFQLRLFDDRWYGEVCACTSVLMMDMDPGFTSRNGKCPLNFPMLDSQSIPISRFPGIFRDT